MKRERSFSWLVIITCVFTLISPGFSWIPAREYDDEIAETFKSKLSSGDHNLRFDDSSDNTESPIIVSNSITDEANTTVINGEEKDYGEMLFLTPIITNEKSSEVIWKELARVRNFTDVVSYSGFFTVNKPYNSNLFFWFFPAAYNAESAPLMVWLNGGPGTSSLFGLFVENGPYKINSDGFLQYRQNPWTLTHSMIYIDSPVGTGFSFTHDIRGYAKNQEDVARDLYEALSQFFKVFPEYISRDLFIAGESYAGKYVPSLAHKIYLENKSKTRKMKMNLKGIIIGSGFSDPATQNEYGEYLYNIGLIDEGQKAYFEKEETRIKALIKSQLWREATEAVQGLVLGYPDRPSYFQNLTNFKYYMNIMETKIPQDFKNYGSFLGNDYVRRAIHVGNQQFVRGSVTVLNFMIEDICKSSKPTIEKLLTEDYKVLFYAPQLDIIVPHTGIDKFVNSLRWTGSNDYARAERKIWRVNDEIAGYTKTARNFVHLFLRNSGHVVSYDQPDWSFEMINQFTRGKPF